MVITIWGLYCDHNPCRYEPPFWSPLPTQRYQRHLPAAAQDAVNRLAFAARRELNADIAGRFPGARPFVARAWQVKQGRPPGPPRATLHTDRTRTRILTPFTRTLPGDREQLAPIDLTLGNGKNVFLPGRGFHLIAEARGGISLGKLRRALQSPDCQPPPDQPEQLDASFPAALAGLLGGQQQHPPTLDEDEEEWDS